MALFVFGAGATRGCSFVDPKTDPCLPPLDRDFFTQLQRVRNTKHKTLISQFLQDVVEVFGANFDVTVETVFTTLEHTIRMLNVTGENRAFKKQELQEKRVRLEQAIAVVLEDSLMEKDSEGHSKLTQRKCDYHDAFVAKILQARDDIITFNYDCVLDFSLKDCGSSKWNPRYAYCFDLGSRGHRLEGDNFWEPQVKAEQDGTVHLLKLHGSLHFIVSGPDDKPKVKLKQRPYTKQNGNLQFTIIPPEWHKAYDKGVFAKLWKHAADAIHGAKHIVVIGYSLPETDLHSTALFRTSLLLRKLKSLVVVNPDRHTRKRIRTVLQRGLSKDTKVLSFERFEHFLSCDRQVWEI